MKKLSIIILTYNEEKNLPFCLKSLERLDADVFVIDSGSSDGTLAIARSFGVNIVEHKFESYATQVNWALENLPIKTPWCMRLDADESLSPMLADEIREKLDSYPSEVTGLCLKLRFIFWGKWIRHGGFYPIWLLRIWRMGKAKCEDQLMDEHMILSEGKIESLSNDFIHQNHKGLSCWIDKHNRYADKEVLDIVQNRSRIRGSESMVSQASKKRWIKQNIYLNSPLFLRAFLYWFYRYFFLLGFCDGIPGLVFHFLQGFWYRFLVDAKLYEMKKG